MFVSVSVFLLMSVTVLISVPAHDHVSVHDRDRVRVHDIILYILSVSVVFRDLSMHARGWGHDHKFECVTVRLATCTFMYNHASV